MTRRLAAAIAGAVLIVGVSLAYALDKHPVVAGSNDVAPLYPALRVTSGAARCQAIDRVPAKANRVRLIASAVQSAGGTLRVKLRDQSGLFDNGVKKQVYPGTVAVGLNRLTRSAHRAQICFVNRSEGSIVFAGEDKRIRRNEGATTKRRRLASVAFIRAHKSTWAARRDVIADRFANSQPGAFGGWSLWLALTGLATAVAIALWWLVFRLEARSK
jgi:hypothetical protein